MATTIVASFNQFKSNLEITDLQEGTVSQRQNSVRSVLERELYVVNSFLSGSYKRSTMIAPLKEADIDIFAVLPSDYYSKYDQAGLLDMVKRVLRKEYTKTPDISRNGQAVTITFSDFVVDVVPSFNRMGGGYLIPNSVTKKWIATDPATHVSLFATANARNDFKLKPLIKMLKCWNKNISFGFSNFHIEVLAYHIFSRYKIDQYSSAIKYFFEMAKNDVRSKNPDPAGYTPDVGAYLNTQAKIDSAVSNLTTAYNRSVKAVEFASQGKTKEAVDEWRKIFGSKFPAYG